MSEQNPPKKRKISLVGAKNKTVNFVKLLWECITYKFLLFVIALVYGIYVFSLFKASVQKEINENTKSFLASMVNESLEKVNIKIKDEFLVLETMTMFYDDEISMEETRSILTERMGNHLFDGVQIIDADGNEVLTVGDIEIRDKNFVEEVMMGEESISTIYVKEDGQEKICLAVPVFDGTDHKKPPVYSMITCYDIEKFINIIDTSTFEQIGTTFISQEDGTLVSRPESIRSTNLFKLLDSINMNNEKSIEKLKKSIIAGQSGIITYGKGKHKRYLCYTVIPDTKWYSVSIVSASSIEPVAKKVSRLAVNFTIHISFVIFIYIIITFGIDMNVIRKRKNAES